MEYNNKQIKQLLQGEALLQEELLELSKRTAQSLDGCWREGTSPE